MQDFVAAQNIQLTCLPGWQALDKHQRAMAGVHLRDLFSQNPERFKQLSLEAAGLLLDYSKNRVTKLSLELLVALAEQRALPQRIEALFNGEKVNSSEGRPALHTVLREQDNSPVYVQGKDVVAEVRAVRERMRQYVLDVQRGRYGEITDWVHIGIGGSDLGPRMVVNALAAYRTPGIRCHFISHADGALIGRLLEGLNSKTTVVLVASKSFKTKEVLCNAEIAKAWLQEGGGHAAVTERLLAVTACPERAREFGVADGAVFSLWDWVGGRFSLWSAIGLSIAIAVGMDHFDALLAGAEAMDQHFRFAPLLSNMPVILALLDIWYVNFFDVKTRVILPYEEALANLPAHLQQLEMESNGKSIGHAGDELDYATAPIIWGALGSNAQHAFLQLLYQGTHLVPVDFIVTANTHPLQVTNCLSQAQALAFGKTLQEAMRELLAQGKEDTIEVLRLAMQQTIPGNCPSNIIFMPTLTPASLGALIALYEHKVFVEGVIWGINSFDQWGIELGKQLAAKLFPIHEGDGDVRDADVSTQGLIAYYRNHGK